MKSNIVIFSETDGWATQRRECWSARVPTHPQQHSPVRDTHEAPQAPQLPDGLAQQVPQPGQENRRSFPRYFPRHLCVLQHQLLDLLPDPGGKY